MERYHAILEDEEFLEGLRKIEKYEEHRIYCRHSLEHLCDVARMMYIFALEEGSDLEQDMIYATALLHDMGRVKEYEDGTPHQEAGVEFAGKILKKHGFSEEEIAYMTDAIGHHRKEQEEPSELEELLHRADKLSRNCFWCKATATCKWAEEKKNQTLIV